MEFMKKKKKEGWKKGRKAKGYGEVNCPNEHLSLPNTQAMQVA